MSDASLTNVLVPSWYSLAIAIAVAAIPTYLLRLRIGSVPTNVFEIIVGALILVGLATPSIRRHWRISERQPPGALIVLVGLFVAAAFVSTLLSDVPRVSFGIFKSWIIIPMLLGWLVYADVRIQNQELRIKKALVISGLIVALLSLIQFKWGERLAGIYDVPNSLALYLVPLIVLAAGAAQGKFWYRFSAAVMFVALLLTQSAAGVMTVLSVASVSLSLLHKTKNTKTKQSTVQKTQTLAFVFSVLFGVCVLSFVFLTSTGRLAYLASPWTQSKPNSISVRLQLWSVSWELIKEHPLRGIGLGQFEPVYQQKLHERFKTETRNQKLETTSFLASQFLSFSQTQPIAEFVYRDPHNWLLSFWLNAGLLGLVSFISLHILVFKQLTPVTAALATLLMFGLVDTIYWKNDLSALHWVLLALMLRSPEVKLDGPQAKNSVS